MGMQRRAVYGRSWERVLPRSATSMPRQLALLAVLAGCPAPPATEAPPYEAVCTEAREVPCQAEMAVDLPVHDAVSTGSFVSSVAGNDWVVDVDATAGGFIESNDNPWLYGRFTDTGLEKVEITDLDAFTDTGWHIAFHRFRVRLNGGSGGPSCVAAAPYPEKTYDALTPDDEAGGDFAEDAYYDASCAFVTDAPEDPNAPEGIPLTALNGWWEYPDCVATTGTPFLVRLDTGRILRFEVLRYYGIGQDECNANGTMGGDAARIQIQWAFLN